MKFIVVPILRGEKGQDLGPIGGSQSAEFLSGQKTATGCRKECCGLAEFLDPMRWNIAHRDAE